jgi:hypothetical protein
MTTRTIVTSQPDVACDVCARRLLRGEQPDVFLVAGRRRTVCELCAPRAVHEGWQRETEDSSLTLPALRSRRGRGLFDRLRQVGRPAGGVEGAPAAAGAEAESASGLPSRYDIFGEEPSHGHDEAAGEGEASAPTASGVGAEDAPAPQDPYLVQAVEVFNASEFPRRVAGVARSLGAPAISVRSAEHLSSVVRIAVAWELCWYRYEVDLSEEGELFTRARGQGTELSELDREELDANALADADGAIRLAQ